MWNSDHGHVVEACKASLEKLQLDYLDLYLVHFPIATKHTGIILHYYGHLHFELFKNYAIFCLIIIGVGTTASALDEDGVLDIDTTISLESTWHAMEETVSLGLVRSIGIRLLFSIQSVLTF